MRYGLLLLSATLLLGVPAAAALGRTMRVTIVPPRGGGWLGDHAVAELTRYTAAMTGVTPRTRPQPPDAGPDEVVITLSLGTATRTLAALPGGDDPQRRQDGFVIRSAGRGRVEIAAERPIGLLYGAYTYLEDCCGVGFFWDGDYVPQRSDLPTADLRIAQVPRWPLRHFNFAFGWGLTKWHNQLRPAAERRRLLDWMAKRKLNLSAQVFSPTIAHSGTAAARVFGLDDRVPDNFTFAGWPGCLDFPAEVRTRLTKNWLGYGRRLGIRWIYYLAFGQLPHQFRETHPEYRYVDNLGYSATALYPDDPEATRWMQAFYGELIRTYGTDHLYLDSPFVESSGAADPEESFSLKLAAAQRMCDVFRALDSKAIWGSDSWDFGALPTVWTPERIARYYAALPREMMLVYDTAGVENPFYQRTNYFGGTRWALATLHSFQGDDHLHGDLQHALDAIQQVSRDPQAGNCQGIFHVPETSGHNVLYFDLTTHLAWQPDGVTLPGYLRQYVRRRFGEADADRMLPAVQALVRAVYQGGGTVPVYHKLGCWYAPEWWPIVDEHRSDSDARPGLLVSARELQQAVDLALECEATQGRNPLYVNDLVDWTRTYLAHLCNWAVLDAYDAFGQGDTARLHRSADLARQCLHHVEAILSTRPDFSLQAQIERVMSVPGTNPYLPWYIKQHCVNDLYSANEVYEQHHWFYAPRLEVYLGELESRAARNVRTIAWTDIADRCSAIQDRWLNEDIAVPAEAKFAGTSMEAVRAAVAALTPLDAAIAGAASGK